MTEQPQLGAQLRPVVPTRSAPSSQTFDHTALHLNLVVDPLALVVGAFTQFQAPIACNRGRHCEKSGPQLDEKQRLRGQPTVLPPSSVIAAFEY
jgi:hypothetical protein